MRNGFDIMKLFKYFLPHNNFDVVINTIKSQKKAVSSQPNSKASNLSGRKKMKKLK